MISRVRKQKQMSCCGRNHWLAWKSAVPGRGQHSVTELQHITYSCSSFIIKGFLFCLRNVSALYRRPYLKLFTLPCWLFAIIPDFIVQSETFHQRQTWDVSAEPGLSLSLSPPFCLTFSNFIICSFARYHQWSTWRRWVLWTEAVVISIRVCSIRHRVVLLSWQGNEGEAQCGEAESPQLQTDERGGVYKSAGPFEHCLRRYHELITLTWDVKFLLPHK